MTLMFSKIQLEDSHTGQEEEEDDCGDGDGDDGVGVGVGFESDGVGDV